MKLTAPTAMPTPKITPASVRLAAPSPKATISPPTTIATSTGRDRLGVPGSLAEAASATLRAGLAYAARYPKFVTHARSADLQVGTSLKANGAGLKPAATKAENPTP